jgi:hypothetical protein
MNVARALVPPSRPRLLTQQQQQQQQSQQFQPSLPQQYQPSDPSKKKYRIRISGNTGLHILFGVFLIYSVVSIIAHFIVLLLALLLPWFITTSSFLSRDRSSDWTYLLFWIGCSIKIIIYGTSLLSIDPIKFKNNVAAKSIRIAAGRAAGYNIAFLVFALISLAAILAINLTLFLFNDPYNNPFRSPPAGAEDFNAERLCLVLTYLYALVEIGAIVSFFLARGALKVVEENSTLLSSTYTVKVSDTDNDELELAESDSNIFNEPSQQQGSLVTTVSMRSPSNTLNNGVTDSFKRSTSLFSNSNGPYSRINNNNNNNVVTHTFTPGSTFIS